MADDDNVTDNVSLWDNTGDNQVEVIIDGSIYRLAVDSKITDIDPQALLARVAQPIQEGEYNSNSQNHTLYTVPASKTLYITSVTTAYSDTSAGTLYIEWQEDGTPFHSHTIGDNIGSNHSVFTDGNPLGPFSAGTVIRARRVRGNSGREWSVSFTGYLEDV